MIPPTVGVFSFGRKQSARCPNKLLRPFAGTTLADIALGKLAAFGRHAFFAARDDEFRVKAAAHGVPFVERSEHSAIVDEPIVEVLSFLRDVSYTHLLIVNACLPLLKEETIRAFLDDAVAGGCAPAFAVARRQNHFLTLDRRPVNFPADMKTINTKTVQPLYEFAHALYFFEREYFFRQGRYWDWQEVRLVEIADRHELVDIDTEDDFTFAEALWLGTRAVGERA
ncbi:MAG: NTP transferase domain-containing protein [Acidobacteriota bacterium]